MASLARIGAFLVLLHIATLTDAHISKIITQVDTEMLSAILSRLYLLEETVNKQYSSFDTILNQLVDERSGGAEKTRRDIIKAIIQSDFGAAEDKMLELGDPKTIAGIVRDMASNSDHDFGALVNFVKGVGNPSLQSQILTNLYYVTMKKAHISTLNLIALAKASSEKGTGYQSGRGISTVSFKKLLSQITANATAVLVNALKSDDSYQDNTEVRALAAGIADWRDVSESVMTGLVAGAFDFVDIGKILKAVSNHSDTWQALVGVDALIEELRDSNSFQGTIVIDIASRLNEIEGRGDLHSIALAKVQTMWTKIPGCLMSLFSLKPFCIKDKLFDTFFISTDGRTTQGTWPPYRWRLTWDGEKMSFVNELGLELYAGKTWVPEPYEENCLIRNFETNEYLYVYEEKVGLETKTFRDLKKKTSGPGEGSSEFVMRIVSC